MAPPRLSRAFLSAKAKAQLRDSKGRFIKMRSLVRWLETDKNGKQRWHHGRISDDTPDIEGRVQVRPSGARKDSDEIRIKPARIEVVRAILRAPQLDPNKPPKIVDNDPTPGDAPDAEAPPEIVGRRQIREFTDDPNSTAEWRRVRNRPGVMKSPDGTLFLVSEEKSPTHTANEMAASRLYRLAGVPVPEVVVRKDADGNNVLTRAVSEEQRPDPKNGFVADAWLANWDVSRKDGRDSVSGALLFRENGSDKPRLSGDVHEYSTLRDGAINPRSAVAYKNVGNSELEDGANSLSEVTREDIDNAFEDLDFDEGTKQVLSNLVYTRQQGILAKAGHQVVRTEPSRTRPAPQTPTAGTEHVALKRPRDSDMTAMRDLEVGDVVYVPPDSNSLDKYVARKSVNDVFADGTVTFTDGTIMRGTANIHVFTDPKRKRADDRDDLKSRLFVDSSGDFSYGWAANRIHEGDRVTSIKDGKTGVAIGWSRDGDVVKFLNSDGRVSTRQSRELIPGKLSDAVMPSAGLNPDAPENLVSAVDRALTPQYAEFPRQSLFTDDYAAEDVHTFNRTLDRFGYSSNALASADLESVLGPNSGLITGSHTWRDHTDAERAEVIDQFRREMAVSTGEKKSVLKSIVTALDPIGSSPHGFEVELERRGLSPQQVRDVRMPLSFTGNDILDSLRAGHMSWEELSDLDRQSAFQSLKLLSARRRGRQRSSVEDVERALRRPDEDRRDLPERTSATAAKAKTKSSHKQSHSGGFHDTLLDNMPGDLGDAFDGLDPSQLLDPLAALLAGLALWNTTPEGSKAAAVSQLLDTAAVSSDPARAAAMRVAASVLVNKPSASPRSDDVLESPTFTTSEGMSISVPPGHSVRSSGDLNFLTRDADTQSSVVGVITPDGVIHPFSSINSYDGVLTSVVRNSVMPESAPLSWDPISAASAVDLERASEDASDKLARIIQEFAQTGDLPGRIRDNLTPLERDDLRHRIESSLQDGTTEEQKRDLAAFTKSTFGGYSGEWNGTALLFAGESTGRIFRTEQQEILSAVSLSPELSRFVSGTRGSYTVSGADRNISSIYYALGNDATRRRLSAAFGDGNVAGLLTSLRGPNFRSELSGPNSGENISRVSTPDELFRSHPTAAGVDVSIGDTVETSTGDGGVVAAVTGSDQLLLGSAAGDYRAVRASSVTSVRSVGSPVAAVQPDDTSRSSLGQTSFDWSQPGQATAALPAAVASVLATGRSTGVLTGAGDVEYLQVSFDAARLPDGEPAVRAQFRFDPVRMRVLERQLATSGQWRIDSGRRGGTTFSRVLINGTRIEVHSARGEQRLPLEGGTDRLARVTVPRSVLEADTSNGMTRALFAAGVTSPTPPTQAEIARAAAALSRARGGSGGDLTVLRHEGGGVPTFGRSMSDATAEEDPTGVDRFPYAISGQSTSEVARRAVELLTGPTGAVRSPSLQEDTGRRRSSDLDSPHSRMVMADVHTVDGNEKLAALYFSAQRVFARADSDPGPPPSVDGELNLHDAEALVVNDLDLHDEIVQGLERRGEVMIAGRTVEDFVIYRDFDAEEGWPPLPDTGAGAPIIVPITELPESTT